MICNNDNKIKYIPATMLSENIKVIQKYIKFTIEKTEENKFLE